jgi:hypothetical protein
LSSNVKPKRFWHGKLGHYRPASGRDIGEYLTARIAVDFKGVRDGLMVEYSEEMLNLEKHPPSSAGLESLWEMHQQNAFDLESLPL